MFRSLGKSKIGFVLAILFGLSLLFFRGGDRYSNLFNSDNVVASVSGTPISTSKFLRAMQMNINQYSQMFGRALTVEEIQAFQIHSMALGTLVNNAVFENEFDSQNFIVDETIVASETKKRFPNLYKDNNKLNETSLNSFLSQQKLKIDDLVKIIDFEARSEIFDKLFFKINYPDKIELVLNKYNDHSRNIDLIKLSLNNFQLPNYNDLDVSINNNQIKDFFNQNINSYINPEKRNISYIIINKDNYVNDFQPSSIEIENYYNDNKNLFIDLEKRDFIQFNFKTSSEASKFKSDIISMDNEEIIKFAKKNNIFFNKFLKVSKNEVLEDLSKVIFSLEKNQVSSIVETPLAKHIIVVNKIYPEMQKTINQTTEEILTTLLEAGLESYILDLKSKINQEILDGFTLDELADGNSLIIKTISNAKIKISETENDLIKKNVIAKGFASNKDFVSDIIEIDENIAIVINVNKIESEKPYELENIFELVLIDWIKSLKIKSIESHLAEINNNSKSMKDISEFIGSEIKNNNIKLDNADYPSAFKNNVFKNDINNISLNIINEDIYISKLKSISFPEDTKSDKITSMLSELRTNFATEIIKSKKISTNDKLIQALINQY